MQESVPQMTKPLKQLENETEEQMVEVEMGETGVKR